MCVGKLRADSSHLGRRHDGPPLAKPAFSGLRTCGKLPCAAIHLKGSPARDTDAAASPSAPAGLRNRFASRLRVGAGVCDNKAASTSTHVHTFPPMSTSESLAMKRLFGPCALVLLIVLTHGLTAYIVKHSRDFPPLIIPTHHTAGGLIAIPLVFRSLSVTPAEEHPSATPRWRPGNSTILNLRRSDWPVPSPIDPSTRYLSYLAHSGFHNQRCALLTLEMLLRPFLSADPHKRDAGWPSQTPSRSPRLPIVPFSYHR